MKTLLTLFAILALAVSPLAAQNLYSPFPTGVGGFLQFSYNNGAPVALGFICATASGTTNNLATFTTPNGTANSNPIALDAAGRAAIYLLGAAYTMALYAPGTGNTCNGSPVGTLIKSVDNVLDNELLLSTKFATLNLDNIRLCDQFPGATAGAKIIACIADLPTTGGTADARALEGGQMISGTISITKPVRLVLGAATYSCAANPCVLSTAAVTIMGLGRDTTILQQSTQTNVWFSHATVGAFQLRDLSIQSLSTQTAGAAILLAGAGGANSNLRSMIENVQFLYQWIGVDSTTAAYWKVANCDFNGVEHRGIRMNQTFNGDEGDNVIEDNFFSVDTAQVTGQAIEWIAAGGARIHGNKYQEKFQYDLHMNFNTAANTSSLVYTGNQHEPMLPGGYALYFERTLGSFTGVNITGNFFRSQYGNDNFIGFDASSSQWISAVAIVGNTMYMPTNSTAIAFKGNANGDLAEISGNTIYGGAGTTSIGVSITQSGTNYTGINIGQNNWVGVATPVSWGTSSPLAGFRVPDNAYFGTMGMPPVSALTERIEIPRGDYYAAVNLSNSVASKLIGQDLSDVVQIAKSGQAVNIGWATANTTVGLLTATTYGTSTNCVSITNPAVCGSAASGASLITVGQISSQVNTTAVTLHSRVLITYDQTLSAELGVTCNTALASGGIFVGLRTAGSSFDVSTANNIAVATNPICYNWMLVNLALMRGGLYLPGKGHRPMTRLR